MNAHVNAELIRVGKKLSFTDKGKIMDEWGIKSNTTLNKYLAGKGPDIGKAKIILQAAISIIEEKEKQN